MPAPRIAAAPWLALAMLLAGCASSQPGETRSLDQDVELAALSAEGLCEEEAAELARVQSYAADTVAGSLGGALLGLALGLALGDGDLVSGGVMAASGAQLGYRATFPSAVARHLPASRRDDPAAHLAAARVARGETANAARLALASADRLAPLFMGNYGRSPEEHTSPQEHSPLSCLMIVEPWGLQSAATNKLRRKYIAMIDMAIAIGEADIAALTTSLDRFGWSSVLALQLVEERRGIRGAVADLAAARRALAAATAGGADRHGGGSS